MTTTRGSRVRAPEIAGAGGWINTGGRALSLAELRGKIVLLDFWTFCCVNCLHVADELRPLEEKHADVLVVIGVHSPKFEHETSHEAVAAAVERYGITHAVLDDPELTTWDAYTARAWPTLVVIDPEGYVAAHLSGEGHAHGLDALIGSLVAEHAAKGTLRRGDSPYVPPRPPSTALRFPSKAAILPDGAVLVADTSHHRLVVLEADFETVRATIGSGARGLVDGDATTARFSEPQGVCVVPADVAARVGYDVIVADTVNHALRGVRLADASTRTIAGTGAQPMTPLAPGTSPALSTQLSSPWDVVWWPRLANVVVAMAGSHQLATFDPVDETVTLLAGTGREGLVDGGLLEAWFAQPSGVAADGERLWIADSETSALRYIDDAGAHTAIGRGLFTFGHKDGRGGEALLQHPLGVTLLPDGSVAICDTYNGALRRYDPRTDTVSTLATGFAEPSGVFLADNALVVVEAGAHRLTAIPALTAKSIDVGAREYETSRPPTDLAPGQVRVRVSFTAPAGQHLDDTEGPATRLVIEASPPELLATGAGSVTELTRTITIADGVSAGVLHVTARVATCDDGAPHAACHLHQQDWGVPVRVTPGGAGELDLRLRDLAS